MFCKYCGKELAEGAGFCAFCGKPADMVDSSETEESPVVESPVREVIDRPVYQEQGIECPRCGSHNTKYVAHTITNTKSGSYSCCAGGCGGLLLGPLGLLLGLCGLANQSTTTTDASRWVCGQCGAEFVSKEQAERGIRSTANVGTGLSVFGMIAIGLLGLQWFGWLLGGFIVICGVILLCMAFKGSPNYSPEDLFGDYASYTSWKQTHLIINAVTAVLSLGLGFLILHIVMG